MAFVFEKRRNSVEFKWSINANEKKENALLSGREKYSIYGFFKDFLYDCVWYCPATAQNRPIKFFHFLHGFVYELMRFETKPIEMTATSWIKISKRCNKNWCLVWKCDDSLARSQVATFFHTDVPSTQHLRDILLCVPRPNADLIAFVRRQNYCLYNFGTFCQFHSGFWTRNQ